MHMDKVPRGLSVCRVYHWSWGKCESKTSNQKFACLDWPNQSLLTALTPLTD